MSSSIPVAAALIFRAGKLLITQRPPDKHLGGLWEFPGGKLEPGESYSDCLKRELREELGVEITPGPMLAAIEHRYPEKSVQLQFYRCQLKSGEPTPIDCSDLEWIGPHELDQFTFPPADAGLVLELKTRPELWE